MKILIAEDDAVSRRLLRGHLERWGHTVVEAIDGAEAWDLVLQAEGEHPFSDGTESGVASGGGFPIVIADWMMPEVDGLELIQRIRARQLPRYVYILMLTAKNEKSDVVNGMDAGADDYLTKPFDKDELRSRLQAGIRILSLQAALSQSEKNAAVGRLAVGVASEIATPVGEVLDSLRELRQDAHALAEAATTGTGVAGGGGGGGEGGRHEGNGSGKAADAGELEQIRSTVGPRFLAAENRLGRVRDLVRSLREFATLDDLPMKPLAVGPLVSDTLAMMKSELASRSLRVDWRPAEGLPTVGGNAGKLKRAFYNLLSVLAENESVGGTLTILARLEETAGATAEMVLVDLCSSSSAIPLEQLPQLFEPFAASAGATGNPPATASATQSGLGLPIAFSILREHGGTLEASPHMGGTRFRVRLPRG